MIFGKFRPDHEILDKSEKSVRDIFPPRHPAIERAASKNSRTKDARIKPARDEGRHRGKKLRRVLVIGMNHNDDVGVGRERETVTGFLIATVTAVFRMHFDLHLFQRPGNRHSLIVTGVIDHDDKIDNPLRHHFVVGALQGARGVVGRHHDDDLLAV